MKPFKFRLERVLKIRETEEDIERNKLLKINAEYQKELVKLNKLEEDRKKAGEKLKDHLNNLNIFGIAYDKLLKGIEYTKKQQLNILKEKEKLVKRQLETYLEAMKKRKVIELLKHKKFQEYLKDVEKENLKFVDELVIERYKPDTDNSTDVET